LIFPAKSLAARTAKLVELAFFPSFCKTCGALLENSRERVLCGACLDKLVPCRSPLCPCCGRFFEANGGSHFCSLCLNAAPPFSCHRSAGRYRGELKDALLLFKYRKYRTLGKNLASFVSAALQKEDGIWPDLDMIIPVPLHWRRRRERGFNQAEVLAREIARPRGLRVETRVLKKIANVPPQTSLEQAGRARNVRNAYRVVQPGKIRGKTVLLVDDVYTTGATLRECAAAMIKAGAKEVRALTVAQA